jgi:hypothetical protein
MTARVSIRDDRLSIERSGWTRWVGGSVDVPLTHISSVAVAGPSARSWFKGIRLAGVQIPGVMTSGLFRQGSDTVWWEVGRGTPIVISLRDEQLTKVIVEVKTPEATVRALSGAPAPTLRGEESGTPAGR